MKITSEKTFVNASPLEVFTFLSESANFEKILPKEQVSDFKFDENGCSFKAKGGITIPLIYTDKIANSAISMKSDSRAPFQYTLTIHIFENDGNSQGFIEFNADINMFMKMMVEKPLFALFNDMTKALQKEFAS